MDIETLVAFARKASKQANKNQARDLQSAQRLQEFLPIVVHPPTAPLSPNPMSVNLNGE